MAAAKKKTTAKRATKTTVKYAAKAQNSAAHTAQKATKASADWMKFGAAADWAKQSATLLPFSQSDMTAASKQAAESMQSATQQFMKTQADMMQQLFGKGAKVGYSAEAFNPAAMFQNAPQLKNFDPSAAQAKMTAFARESAEQMTKSANSANRAVEEAMELSRENSEAMVEVSNVAVAVSKEITAEMISYVNKCFAQNVELSKQVLSVRTLNDLFDLASRMMKTNLDGFFSESVKLSEKMFQCATDVSEPLNERLSDTTERLSKAMAA